jgi:CDP-diacylglycerol--glycerol-3-phosphate 3-phosphatidyltransferase
LILSGANLSEEYFTNRLDRYMSFTNSGAGLVDFYAELCDVLCKYALRYDGKQQDITSMTTLFTSEHDTVKHQLEESLMQLYNGDIYNNTKNVEENQSHASPVVAFAVPTFQMPESFLNRPPRFRSDIQTTCSLLQSTLDDETSLSVRLSSAYLNLTPSLLSILSKFGRQNHDRNTNNGSAYLLTAGAISHGFAPKKGKRQKQSVGIINKIKDSIPDAFMSLVKQVAESIIKRGGKVLMYERAGWTFHAKGLWITADGQQSSIRQVQREIIHDSYTLVGTVIGSGNYGARSEDLDVESNLVLIFNETASQGDTQASLEIKSCVIAEWNDMCQYSNELVDTSPKAGTENTAMQVVLGFLKRFL